jgi:hypothetical protein
VEPCKLPPTAHLLGLLSHVIRQAVEQDDLEEYSHQQVQKEQDSVCPDELSRAWWHHNGIGGVSLGGTHGSILRVAQVLASHTERKQTSVIKVIKRSIDHGCYVSGEVQSFSLPWERSVATILAADLHMRFGGRETWLIKRKAVH